MGFVDVLQEYFRGEKHVGVALAVIGVALLAGASWVHRNQEGGIVWGLALPLVLAGLAFGGGGALLAARSERQITELASQYERDPDKLLAAEVPRMARVNANWPRLKLAWSIVMIVALVLPQAVRRDWATGLCLSLLLLMTILYFTDVFAERRAERYTQALDQARSARMRAPP